MTNQTIGERIAQLRRKKNTTQEAMAEQLGVTPQAVSKWENDISCPDITLLPPLAALLGVTVDELLGCEEKPAATLLPEERRKPLSEMIFRIYVNTHDGDKVRVNLPMSLVQLGLQIGAQMPQVAGSGVGDAMKNIDLQQLIALVEQGVVGKLVEVETADGDIVEIVVE